MKAIVIGLGSMGKRRIRLLSEHPEITVYGIDSNAARAAEVAETFGIECFDNIDEAVEATKPDCAFVCTSPLSHANIITTCLEHNLHVFTEINLVDTGYERNMHLAAERGKVLFLSSTALYKEETENIIRQIKASPTVVNYIYHVGQYLPDWHPWESYKDYFIGDRRTNGCREIMAIELPWMVTAFGPIKSVQAINGKDTKLNIDYPDNYMILIEHEGGSKGTFVVDVVSRKAVRRLDCFSENIYLTWQGTSDSLTAYNIAEKRDEQIKPHEEAEHVEGYAKFISENPYRREINAFLAQIANPACKPVWDFQKDLHVLQTINEIEK